MKRKAFTLIELLVVVAILAAVGVTTFSGFQVRYAITFKNDITGV